MSQEEKKPTPQDVLVEAMGEFATDEPDQVLILMRFPRSAGKAAYAMKHSDMTNGDALWLLEQCKQTLLED